ncbi:MAG: hypothetical protein EOP11_26035 [Proteobacteria bacterium]|nr:MAG: hypothetical protein EOP11_26035 [Pseudomonadota bacterium]
MPTFLLASFIIQLSASLFLTGLIWVIQLVHYPMLRFVALDHFEVGHLHHTSRMGWIAAPVMILELGTAIVLAWSYANVFWIAQLLAVLALWAFTFGLSVPLHQRLSKGMNEAVAARLIATNWPRTLLWSARSVGLLAYLFILLKV